MLRKLLSAFFSKRKHRPEWLVEWENQRYLPALEWTQDQWDTHRWLKAIEHDQRKRGKLEAGAIFLHLEKGKPDIGEQLMKILVLESCAPDNRPSFLGTILIAPDGEVVEGNKFVELLVERRHVDPLRPPEPRSLH